MSVAAVACLEFTANAKVILDQLKLLLSIVPTNPTGHLTLTNVLFESKDGTVVATGMDSLLAIRQVLTVDSVTSEGKGLVLGSKLNAVLKELGDETFSLTFDENDHAIVKSEGSKLRIPSENPNDYPEIETPAKATVIEFKPPVLASLISRVSFSASEEAGRFAFDGVNLALEKTFVRVVATDSRRLAMGTIRMETGIKKKINATVPTKSMSMIRKILEALSDHETKIGLSISTNAIRLATSSTTVVSRLRDGEYPPIDRILELEWPWKVKVGRERMVKCLKKASLALGKSTRCVVFKFKAGELELIARDAEVGEAEVSLPTDYTGDEMTIGFSGDSVLDMLKALTKPSAFLNLGGTRGPVMCREDDEHGSKFKYIVMGMTAGGAGE